MPKKPAKRVANKWHLIDDRKLVLLPETPEEVAQELLGYLSSETISQPGAIVDLVSPTLNILSVGIRDGRAYLGFINADRQPPYFVVTDPSSARGKVEDLQFAVHGQASFHSTRNTVNLKQMADAIMEYCQHDRLPLCVDWEEV
jgi:Immunity protein Imm1